MARPRILAYHGVDDPNLFLQSVDQILDQYAPVDGDQIAEAIVSGTALPRKAVWFTFDDGLKSSFEIGEALAARGIRATIFVNPASIDRPELLWFQAHELAQRMGLISDSESERFSLSRLKSLPDRIRRSETDQLGMRVSQSGAAPSTLSGTREDMRRWLDLGHEIGNHTWDHPCLDRCTSSEQEEQLRKAHDWLVAAGVKPRFMAYPNGDWTETSAEVARQLGYVGSLLFDHRLARMRSDPHRISRLRIDAGAESSRVESIVSGAHSFVFAPLRWLS